MTLLTRFLADTPSNWHTFQKVMLLLVAVLTPALSYAGCPPWVQVVVACAGSGAAFAAQFTVAPEEAARHEVRGGP